ncbi:MAG: hypothetical protein ACPF9E_19290, partial [Alteromonas oceani]
MMRYLLVIVPTIMGCVELSSRESTGMGWLLIGIGVFFLLARFTGLFNQVQADNANFDRTLSIDDRGGLTAYSAFTGSGVLA